jgi:hypothetical protein
VFNSGEFYSKVFRAEDALLGGDSVAHPHRHSRMKNMSSFAIVSMVNATARSGVLLALGWTKGDG